MAQARMLFPQDFLWGTATAAHQVEGQNTNNDWWQWEQENGRILVNIIDPEIMLGVGENSALADIACDAKEKLQRVAAALGQ